MEPAKLAAWGGVATSLVAVVGGLLGAAWFIINLRAEHQAEHAALRQELLVMQAQMVASRAEHDRAVTVMREHVIGHDARVRAFMQSGGPVPLPSNVSPRDHQLPTAR